MLNSPYTKWTKKPRLDRGWAEAKKYIRKALADDKAINKITTGETNFGANAVEERRMSEVSDMIGQSMDNLALAVVTKQATLDMLSQTNTTLAKANAKQQTTISKVTTKITSLTSKWSNSQLAVALAMLVAVVSTQIITAVHTGKSYQTATPVEHAPTKRRATRWMPHGGTPWEEALGTLAMEMHPMG